MSVSSLDHIASAADGTLEGARLASALLEWEAIAAAPKELLIDGRWVEATSGLRLVVDDPATGEALCEVADAGRPEAFAIGVHSDRHRHFRVSLEIRGRRYFIEDVDGRVRRGVSARPSR